ncbi:MAG: hypothetical protein WBM78_06315 [Desulfobacterales bacterium]
MYRTSSSKYGSSSHKNNLYRFWRRTPQRLCLRSNCWAYPVSIHRITVDMGTIMVLSSRCAWLVIMANAKYGVTHLLQQTRQSLKEILPVLVIFENRFVLYSSNDDMLQGTG